MAATYDIVLAQDGTTLNHMLLKQGNKKAYKVSDSPLLPETIIIGDASVSNISPDREIQIVQNDWRNGIQDLMLEDERKYYKSENCDARFKGKVILSPKELTAKSYSGTTYVPIANAGFEEGSNSTLHNWVEDAGQLLRSTTSPQAGSYCAKLDGTNTQASQKLMWDDSLQGNEITFTAQLRVVSDNAIKIGIADGQNTTWSDTYTNATHASWAEGTVTRTLHGSATKLQLLIFSVVGDGYADTCAVTAGAYKARGKCAKIVNFGTDIVLASGTKLCKLDGANFAEVADFIQTITDLCVYQSNLYIAVGNSDNFWYTSDLVVFKQSILSNSTAKHMSNIENKQFWISDTANTMRDSDDPVNGGTAFTTVYTLPNSDYNITGLMNNLNASTVYVRKQGQLYYLSGADVYTLIPDLGAEVNTSIDYPIYPWKGNLYIPSGVNSFYEYNNGVVTTLSPIRYAPGDTDFDEEITAIAGDETYLYIALDNGDDIGILAGHWETIEGTTSWVWHPIYDKTSNNITAMLISNVSGDKCLYAGTDTHTDNIYNYIVPVSYADVLAESSYEVESSGDFITPWFTTNFATMDKYWRGIDVINRCLYNKTRIIVYFQEKGDISWTCLGVCSPRYVESGYPTEGLDEFLLKDTLQEYYDEHSNDVHAIYGDNWATQTFTPTDATHTITAVRLFVYRSATGDPGTITVSIKAVDGSHKPTGSALCSGTIDGNMVSIDSYGYWSRIDLGDGTELTKDTEYAIEVKASASASGDALNWYYDSTGTYTGGERLTSTNAGVGWTDPGTHDLCFQEFKSGGEVTSKRVRFKFSLSASDDDYSPILYGEGGGMTVKSVLQAECKKVIEATIVVASSWTDRDKTVVSRTISTDLTALRALYASKSALTVTGPDETEYDVVFDRDGYSEQLAYDEIERIEQYWVTVKLLEV